MSDKALDRVAKATPVHIAQKIKGLSDRAIAWIFVGPTIFLLLAINIFPLIWTINLSFTNFKANRTNRAVEYIGTRNYERILNDADIWISMQATAHFLFWTIFFPGADRLYPGLADQQEIQGQRPLDHHHSLTHDVIACRGREFLDFSLSAPDWAV